MEAVAPLAERLGRSYRGLLRDRQVDPTWTRALLAITPAAASRHRGLASFLEQVRYNGRRLAKLDAPPEDLEHLLSGFGALLEHAMDGAFAPAREQLRLATTLALNRAYFEVREAEARTLFALQQAEVESAGAGEMLARSARILARALGARACRVSEPGDGGGARRLRKPLYIEREKAGEDLFGSPWRGKYASFWSYPVGGEVALQFAFPKPYPWLPRELELLEAAARRCREVVERERLRSEVRRLDAESRHAEEQERSRIGRELHDEAGQSLLFLRLQLEMLEREAPAAMLDRLREARDVTERTVCELRRIVAALSPSVLERLGLAPALRQLAARFQAVHPADLELRISLPRRRLPARAEQVIYRVAQECLQNVARHSRATRVIFSLRSADRGIRLSVADNGAGFSADTADRPMSFGLAGMRERASLMGGSLAIRSAPGKGAAVTLTLPGSSVGVGPHVEDSHTAN